MKAAALACSAALLAGTVTAAASAHGDPASDDLLRQDVFLPFDARVDDAARARLSETVRAARDTNFTIKVAVIASRFDLGPSYAVFGQPQRYAEILGLELSAHRYKSRLLVVMPKGYGYSIDGRSVPPARRVISPLGDPGSDVTGQVEAATVAVRKLARAEGHTLEENAESDTATRDRITIAAVALLVAALLGAAVLRRGRSRAQA